MNKIKDQLILKLLIAVILGLLVGGVVPESFVVIVVIIKDLLGQLIFFTIPFIILGFIAPSIITLQSGATKLLTFSVGIAYCSTVGAAIFAMLLGYSMVPRMPIEYQIANVAILPESIFTLEIPPLMSAMSALVLAIMFGLGVSATQSKTLENLFSELQMIVLTIIHKFTLPILPYFISCTFLILSYEGSINQRLPTFFMAIITVIIAHFIWLFILYLTAAIYTSTNPKEVFRHYLPAYCTAIGTMSSAATLPVALKCAKQSSVLTKDSVNFGIPLFSNIHLCGSVLTEVFFVMVVSQILYGRLPEVSNMLFFIVLLGIFGIGAPGVPGGTVMASLGLLTSVLGFDTSGTALMLTIFALQDSFGTACNVTGDGALVLMLSHFQQVRH